jgi:phage terminase small subunit
MEYIANGQDASKAADAAGYATTQRGCKTNVVLKRPKVQRYLAIRLKAIEKKEIATMEWKMDKLVGIVERTEEVKPQVAISGISELNKMQGHYAPTKTEAINVNLDIDILKAKELSEAIARKRKDY